jgi:hypothetical protein
MPVVPFVIVTPAEGVAIVVDVRPLPYSFSQNKMVRRTKHFWLCLESDCTIELVRSFAKCPQCQ